MFQSILNKFSSKNGLIVSDNFVFNLDINTVEQHTSKLKLTENPIENGANIADHAVLDPKEVTVSGLVVSYEPNTNSIKSSIKYHFEEYPLSIPISPVTKQAVKMVKGYYASLSPKKEKKINQVIADFLPNYQSPRLNSLSSDRIADAYEKLLAIQCSGEPVTLQTNTRQYKNMVITSVGLSQKQNTVGEFTLTFREILIVDTQIATGLKIPKPKVRNLGKTQPQEVDNTRSGTVLGKAGKTTSKEG